VSSVLTEIKEPALSPKNLQEIEEAVLLQLKPGKDTSLDDLAAGIGLSVTLAQVRRAVWDLVDQGKLTLTPDFLLTRQR
jgi:hypothetical protein